MPSSDMMYMERYSYAGSLSNIGNPYLQIPKTISYELGVEYNVLQQFLFHLSGYYKDVAEQTNSVSYTGFTGISYTTYANQNYADIRGFEVRIDKRYGQWLTGWVNYNYMVTMSGYFGRYQYYEDPRQQALAALYDPKPTKPIARPVINANLNLRSPVNFGPGPTVGGAKLLGYMQTGLLFTWRAGRYSTWDPLSTGKLIQNVQWRDDWNIDARFAKRMQFGKYQVQLLADLNNILDRDQISSNGFRPGGDDELRYMLSLHLPMYEGADYKASGYTPGKDRPGDIGGPGTDKPYIDMPDRISFTYLNPRSVFFGIKVDF
jgi:outer membrane receptor protein involved in Fe transport